MTVTATPVETPGLLPASPVCAPWGLWLARLGALATAAYVATLIAIVIQSRRPPTYEFEPASLFVCSGLCGAVTIATLRWRVIRPVQYLLPMALILLGFFSYPSTSRDPFHYLFDGALIRLQHLSPYAHAPSEFPLNQYSAVFQDTYWFHLPSPYGPVWQALMAAVNWLSSDHLKRGLMLLRGLDAAALIVSAYYVAAISRRSWLAYGFLLNPVMLLNTTFTPHPDIVMAACMLAAFHHRRVLVRGGLLAIAGLIKPHALVVAPFFERRFSRSLPLLVLTATLVMTVTFSLHPLVRASLREALAAGATAWHDGNYSFLLNRVLPNSSPERVAAISSLLFAAVLLAIYFSFLARPLTSVAAIALSAFLVPVVLLGLVYPWHFVTALTMLSLTTSGVASVALLVTTVLAFLAPVNLFKFALAVGLSCAVYGLVQRLFAGTSLIRWWTIDTTATQDTGLTR